MRAPRFRRLRHATHHSFHHNRIAKTLKAHRWHAHQRWLWAEARRLGTLPLTPRQPGLWSGSVEHYYHFLFELLLPLVLLANRTPRQTTFVLRDIGPLGRILLDLYPERVRLVAKDEPSHEKAALDLLGLSPTLVSVTPSQLQEFAHTLFDRVGILARPEPRTALVIERVPPDDFYLQESVIKGGGASRRSIRNQQCLLEQLRQGLGDAYDIRNVQLEHTSFEEQLRLFSGASLLVAQHGAGMANSIFMPEGSKVLEFGFQNRQHFKTIAKIMGHHYTRIQHREKHITVHPEPLSRAVLSLGL